MADPLCWDDFSRDYEETAEPFTSRMALYLADRLQIGAGEDVVDIACGPGALALHLARRGARVTAVDHSDGMVSRLRVRAEQAGLSEQVDAQAMDGQALALPANRFDVAISAFGIFLFPDNETGLSEAVRVLRPGGRLGLATWEGPFGAGPSLLLHSTMSELFPERDIRFPSAGAAAWGDSAQLQRVLEAAGLVEVTIRPQTDLWTFPSTQWVIDHAERLFKIFPSWAELTSRERSRVVARAVERLNGDLAVPSTALLATASKAGIV